jgi:MFS family permease
MSRRVSGEESPPTKASKAGLHTYFFFGLVLDLHPQVSHIGYPSVAPKKAGGVYNRFRGLGESHTELPGHLPGRACGKEVDNLAKPSTEDGGERPLMLAVFLSAFFIRLGFGLTLSVYSFYIGSTVETTGLTAAAAPAMEAATVLFAGLAADRYGRLPVLKTALIAGAGLLFLMSFTRTPDYLAIISGFFGLASAAILASSLAVIGDLSKHNKRGLQMGRFDALNLGGWVYGFALGYVLVSVLNGVKDPAQLAMAFWVGAAAVVFALLLLSWLSRGHKELGQEHVLDPSRLKEALAKPVILLVILPWMAIYMLIGALFTFLGASATTLHVPTWELGVGVAVGGTVLLFTQPFYGRLSDRIGRSRVMLIGVIGFLGILAFGGAIVVWGLYIPFVAGLGFSAVGALAFGPSSLAALTDVSKTVSRATTMSLYSVVIAGGMAIGLVSASLLFTLWNGTGVLVFFALVGALLVVFTLLRVRYYRSKGIKDTSPLISDPGPAPR